MNTLGAIVAAVLGILGAILAAFGGGWLSGRRREQAKQDQRTLDELRRIEDAKAAARDHDDWRDRLRSGK